MCRDEKHSERPALRRRSGLGTSFFLTNLAPDDVRRPILRRRFSLRTEAFTLRRRMRYTMAKDILNKAYGKQFSNGTGNRKQGVYFDRSDIVARDFRFVADG